MTHKAPDSEQREMTDSLKTVIILHIRILRGQLDDLVESLTSSRRSTVIFYA